MDLLRVGTAGWNVPRAYADLCGGPGSHLERYAAVMNCVEVNSSFYRPHQRKTWEKWAAATPAGFRFAVKAPKTITHMARLVNCGEALVVFLEQVAGLGEKLGPILFQLPPKGVFDASVARDFLSTLREMYSGQVALEPRHVSWFGGEADRLLREFEVGRVAADPPQGSDLAAKPGGYEGLRYYRWHGSPRVYWSAYNSERIGGLAGELAGYGMGESWVIFDNTAAGAALGDAMELVARAGDSGA